MPKCEECEYRFKCYTLAITERPKKVAVNWRITNTCGKCRSSTFGVTSRNGRTITRSAGLCDKVGMVIHKDSAICSEKNFEPRKVSSIDKIYKEIREVLGQKNGKTKLPKSYARKD